jgi:hypothetical protein
MHTVREIKKIKKEVTRKILELKSWKHDPIKEISEPKYPKLLLLILVSIFTYYLFSTDYVQGYMSSLNGAGYVYAFIFGCLFTFGFSTPISIGFFLSYSPESVLLAALIGGFGAVITDLTIFKLIKFSFMDEFEKLKKEKAFIKLNDIFRIKMSEKIKLYLTFMFAGLIIASPLPDEIGVTMLAGLSKINTYKLAILSFIFNSIGIYIMLSI